MKKYVISLLCMVIIFLGIYKVYKFKNNKPVGTVIVLNGPSAAGKTSIQKEFQKLMMPNLWIKLGIDTLFDQPMPDITLENIQFWQTKNPIRWVETTKDVDGNDVITLFVGEQGENVVNGMHSAIAAYAKNGCNIIVDYIGYKKEWLEDLRDQLKDVKTYWVKVEIPLSVLEEREVARATSPKGHARSHYDFVYGNISYDLSVSTAVMSAQECAVKIKEFIEKQTIV